ncbi:MAG: type II secretion system protein GspK [Methylococcaceae bacterium]|nr:type II secretion system protein GspK [Methylococcaceae bacterium]
MSKPQGMALVLVLWILSLLTIIAGSFALSMRRETTLVSGLKNNASAMATAESGLAIAEFMLQNPDLTKRWRADGSIYEIASPTAKLRIQLLSETGKINLNNVEQTLLQDLLNQAPSGSNAQLPSATVNRAAAILDWRDSDDLTRIDGAEKKQYQDAGLNYSPRNHSFQTLEELQMVLGMDEATLKWLEPLCTVYSDAPQVDLQLASKEVLQLMSGIDAGLIDSYIAARVESAKNNLPAPPPPLSPIQSATTAEVTVLTIISEVQLDDQSTALVNAIVKKAEGIQSTPYEVLRWQRSTANNVSLFTDKMNELIVKHYAESEFNN